MADQCPEYGITGFGLQVFIVWGKEKELHGISLFLLLGDEQEECLQVQVCICVAKGSTRVQV